MKNLKTLSEAVALHQNGQLKPAIELYQKILKSEPANFDALHMLGAAQLQKGDISKAIENLRLAVKAKPESAPANYNFGRALAEQKQFAAAKVRFQKAVELLPTMIDAWVNLGHCHRELGELEAHLDCNQKALALQPNDPELLYNLGNAWKKLGYKEKAANCYHLSLAIQPDYAEALYNLGVIELEQGLTDRAIAQFRKALEAKWIYFEAWTQLGNALANKKKHRDATESFDQALKISPDYEWALFGKGQAHCQLKEFEKGLPLLKKAVKSKPFTNYWLGSYIQSQMQACDWSETNAGIELLKNNLKQYPLLGAPWTLCSLPFSRQQLLQHSRHCHDIMQPKEDERLPDLVAKQRNKIRVGYFSSDLHSHPVGFLIGELIGLHDRSRFEIVGFYLGNNTEDAIHKELRSKFDEFHEVAALGHKELAEFARLQNIDIAVDLNGHTGEAKTQSFVFRTAPVQVNFLGYPGTMGIPEYDYILADEVVIPAGHEDGYSEKIARMPNSFFINNRNRKIAQRDMTRAEFGLPEAQFIFCCMNNSYKITPEIFNSWIRILKRCENSVLWIGESNPMMKASLSIYAKKQDIAPSRLIFAERLPDMAEHLARHRLADLFLDTPQYNAHTTSADALWAGLPVLTISGETFASRVAASQLTAAGLPELISKNLQEYEDNAVDYYKHPEKLTVLKEKLNKDLMKNPLFDTDRYVVGLEKLFERMQALALEGSAAKDLSA